MNITISKSLLLSTALVPFRSSLICILSIVLMPSPIYAQSLETNSEIESASGTVITLDPVIVTARRVSENLQKTPVAISVQRETDLSTGKVERLQDLNTVAPNVMFVTGNGPAIVIRGIGNQTFAGLDTQGGVGLFLDDIFIGRSPGVPSFMEDLQRVEVVRGSQVTLYGKNTIGGAINFITQDPSDIFSGETEVTYGTDNLHRVRNSFDAPMFGGKLLTRTFLTYSGRDGDIKNLTTGKNEFDRGSIGGRFTAMAEISDRTSARFTIDYERVDDGSDQAFAPLDLALNHQDPTDFPANRKITRGGASLKIKHDFDAFELVINTGVRAFDASLLLDGDYSALPLYKQGQLQKQHQFSQEIRLHSKPKDGSPMAGDLSWLGGAFYMHDNLEGYWLFDGVAVPSGLESRNSINTKTNTMSLFGNVGYRLTNNFEISAGGRYTYENKKSRSSVTSPFGTFAFGFPYDVKDNVEFHNFSPELALKYDLSDQNSVFARVSRGFKAGGISQFQTAGGEANSYDPETSWNYEIGTKTSWMDGRLKLNATAFYTDWKDQQVLLLLSAYQNIVSNAASATSKGVELEATFQVNDNLLISANYGYLDAKFENYVDPIRGDDYSGNPIPLAPKHSAGLNMQWSQDLSNDMLLEADLRYSFRSPYTFDPLALAEQKPTHLVSAEVALTKGGWKASIWGKNLLNQKYIREYFYYNNTHYGVAEKGRTLGISLKRKW